MMVRFKDGSENKICDGLTPGHCLLWNHVHLEVLTTLSEHSCLHCGRKIEKGEKVVSRRFQEKEEYIYDYACPDCFDVVFSFDEISPGDLEEYASDPNYKVTVDGDRQVAIVSRVV